MKKVYRITADMIWLIHLSIVLIVLFGWIFPEIWPLYVSVLILTLLSEILWSYCILSKWEFDLRKKIDSSLDYEYTYASYYTYKLTHGRLSRDFLGQIGRVFITSSLIITFYFKFFY